MRARTSHGNGGGLLSDNPISLAEQPAVPLAVIKRTARQAELAVIVPKLCGEVWAYLKAQNIRGGRNAAVYWNGDIRLEVGVELAVPFEQSSEVVRSATPAGLVASAVHYGPYHQLGQAHEAVRQYCKQHGHKLAGPNWEFYGHWQDKWTTNPSLIRTDVCYLVAPR